MGKRSRRERREHQASRAVASQDPEALRELAGKSPELAAQHLATLLAASTPRTSAEPPRPIETIAADLAATLRREGRFAAAARLAAAGARLSSRLRLEHALAAFASGDDDAAATIALTDSAVETLIAPLLGAARNSAPVSIPAPNAPSIARSLHAAATAVAHATRGEDQAARSSLRRIAPRDRPAMLATELGAAIDLASPKSAAKAKASLEVLASSPALRESSVAHLAALAEITFAAPELSDKAARRLNIPEPEARPILTRARLARLRSKPAGVDDAESQPSPVHAAIDLVRELGADAFEPSERATAHLYEGFALLDHDPTRAARCLDRSIELGGDLVEALRGKLLLASSGDSVRCAHCDRAHPRAPEPRKIGAAGDRLSRALRHVQNADALAAAASLIAANAWTEIGDDTATLASVAAARAGASTSLTNTLDRLEALATAARDSDRSHMLLDAVLARTPGDRSVWAEKIELAEAMGDIELADRVVLAAAEATKDPVFCADARRIRGLAEGLAPYDGFVPGAVTAGALAAELERVVLEILEPQGKAQDRTAATELQDPMPPLAIACRAALAPPARLAFDAASLAIVENFVGQKGDSTKLPARFKNVGAHFAELAQAWIASPSDLGKLGCLMMFLEQPEPVVAAARALAETHSAGRAIFELGKAALGAEDSATAEKILRAGSPSLERREIAWLRANMNKHRIPGALDPEAVIRELDRALVPEWPMAFRLLEDGEDFIPDPSDASDARPAPKSSSAPTASSPVASLLREMGLDAELARAPAAALRAADQEIERLEQDPNVTPMAIIKVLERLVGAAALGKPQRRAPT